jgi:predicted nucleic acid-binding protein
MYLIDTNVLSEARRRDTVAIAWLRRIDPHRAFLSVVTIGEIEKGAALQRRRGDIEAGRSIETWLAGIVQGFSRHILDIDQDVMLAWGRLQAAQPRPAMDCLIAATALVHRMTVVTRNVADFGNTGVTVLSPWPAASR